jgi:hypothetical protein
VFGYIRQKELEARSGPLKSGAQPMTWERILEKKQAYDEKLRYSVFLSVCLLL